MLSEREILFRNVKCAAARERIYFISLDATASNFTMTTGHYFTSKGYFTINANQELKSKVNAGNRSSLSS